MKLLLPGKIRSQWTNALRAAGRREIGGVLLGELVKPGTFKIAEITIQRSGGTFCHFVRDPKLHEKAIEQFFEHTGVTTSALTISVSGTRTRRSRPGQVAATCARCTASYPSLRSAQTSPPS
jgi:hypothetical protein